MEKEGLQGVKVDKITLYVKMDLYKLNQFLIQ